jgi:hypothetical protein
MSVHAYKRFLAGLTLLAALVGTLAFAGAQAQTRPARAKPRQARPHADGGEAARSSGDAGSSGELVQQKTVDGGLKVFRFGELEIEGRLKNPQLVFFLRRVRAEFAAGDLGHRSFLRELGQTKTDPNL